ncbi:MAG: hypothetical protein K2H53_06240 [Clostridia bacterium]|nr:hypothetical protein [Clostridia bacterium]
MEKLERELKTKMIENDLAVKMQKDTVENYLEQENNIFTSVVTSFNKEISKVKKFVFDEDQVTVTFDSKVEKQVKYLENTLEENKELSKKADFAPIDETITLKKVDGTWKVIYADLQYTDYSSGYGISTMMVY